MVEGKFKAQTSRFDAPKQLHFSTPADHANRAKLLTTFAVLLLIVMTITTYFLAKAYESMNPERTIWIMLAAGIDAVMVCTSVTMSKQLKNAKNRHNIIVKTTEDQDLPKHHEHASLKEIENLILGQEPYFAIQLARALLKTAQSYPILVRDIEAMKQTLDEKQTPQQESPCPQAMHLEKMIQRLERHHED